MEEFTVSTREKYQLVDITDKLEKAVMESGLKDGQILVFVPHSTAAVLLTENEEGLRRDWLDFFKKLVSGFNFQHDRIDNNASSHILSGFLGQARTIPIENNQLVRGTWQQVFLAEFDGPKERRVKIRITP